MVEKEQAVKCCVHCWRILFIVLNSLFLVIGLALIGLSIYLLATQNDLTILTGSRIASGAVLVLIAGFITTVISFIGVIGAIGMWPAMLIVYIVLLFVIVVLEIIAGILGFVYQTELVDISAARAQDAITRYRPVGDEEHRGDINSIVDFLQGRFDCCGYTSFSDWLETVYFNQTWSYPDSCNCSQPDNPEPMVCMDVEVDMGGGSQTIYTTPCNMTFSQFLNGNLAVVGGVGIAFGIFEVLGIGVAITLTCCFCYIRKNKEDYEFTKAI